MEVAGQQARAPAKEDIEAAGGGAVAVESAIEVEGVPNDAPGTSAGVRVRQAEVDAVSHSSIGSARQNMIDARQRVDNQPVILDKISSAIGVIETIKTVLEAVGDVSRFSNLYQDGHLSIHSSSFILPLRGAWVP